MNPHQKINIVPAIPDDAGQISSMARVIWLEHYPAIISYAQIDYMLQSRYHPDLLRQQIENGQLYLLLGLENTRKGFLHLEIKNPYEGFIHKWYLLADARGKGLAKASFVYVVNTFPELSTIRLQVNRKNFMAINAYFKMGFVIEQVKDFDIGGGYWMEDFIMCWRK